LNSQLVELRAQLENQEKMAKLDEKKMKDLEKELASRAKVTGADLDDLKKKLDDASGEMSKWKEMAERLGKDDKTKDGDIVGLTDQVAKLTADNELLNKTIKDLTTETKDLARFVEDMTRVLEDSQSNCTDLQEQLDNCTQNHSGLEATLTHTKESLSDWERKFIVLTGEHEQLQELKQTIGNNSSLLLLFLLPQRKFPKLNLEIALESTTKKLSDAETELSELKPKFENMSRELAEAMTELEEKQKTLEGLTKELTDTKAEFNELLDEKEEIQRELDDHEAMLQKEIEKYNILVDEADTLEEERTTLIEECSKMQADKISMVDSIHVLEKQSKDRLAQVEKLDFNYGKLMGRYALVLTELERSYVKHYGDTGKIVDTD
jgi:myosin protein heavy chain